MWARIGCTIVIACCLLVKPLSAQTQNEQEQQQLKEKIQQLEQLTQASQARIDALEKSQQGTPQVVNAGMNQPADGQHLPPQQTVAPTPATSNAGPEVAVATAATHTLPPQAVADTQTQQEAKPRLDH